MRIEFDHGNQVLFRRQGLFAEAFRAIPAVLENAFGIHASSPSCYLSALARLREFSPSQLDDYVEQDRSAVRIPGLRVGMHTIPIRHVGYVARSAEDRLMREGAIVLRRTGVTPDLYRKLSADILDILSAGAQTLSDIHRNLDRWQEPKPGALNAIVAAMCARRYILRASVKGGWRSNIYRYARWDSWLPHYRQGDITRERALQGLAEIYFIQYGPARIDDFMWWSGVSEEEWGAVEKRVMERLSPVTIGQNIEGYFTHPISQGEFEADVEMDAGALALLPPWDPITSGYRERSRLVTTERHDYVYDPLGNATYAILAPEGIVGVWDFEEAPGFMRIRCAFFEDHAPWLPGLMAWTTKLRTFFKKDAIEYLICGMPSPLSRRRTNSFLKPLHASPVLKQYEPASE